MLFDHVSHEALELVQFAFGNLGGFGSTAEHSDERFNLFAIEIATGFDLLFQAANHLIGLFPV